MCHHVGYNESQKAFRACDTVSCKVFISRDVDFQEPYDPAIETDQPRSIFDRK